MITGAYLALTGKESRREGGRREEKEKKRKEKRQGKKGETEVGWRMPLAQITLRAVTQLACSLSPDTQPRVPRQAAFPASLAKGGRC